MCFIVLEDLMYDLMCVPGQYVAFKGSILK